MRVQANIKHGALVNEEATGVGVCVGMLLLELEGQGGAHLISQHLRHHLLDSQ